MARARLSLALAAGAALTLSACTDPQYAGIERDNTPRRNHRGDPRRRYRSNYRRRQSGGTVRGAAIGAGIGAIAGDILDRQEADLRRDLDNSDVDITNTGDRLIVTMPNNILFATDSYTVRADLQRDLRSVASNLLAYPNSTIQVIGHTDNEGDASYNQTLSERRANAVADVLMAEGVPFGRIDAIGRGESQPVTST